MIVLRPPQRDVIVQHAEAEYPHECCGLLIGRFDASGHKKIVVETLPVSNAREGVIGLHASERVTPGGKLLRWCPDTLISAPLDYVF